MMFSQEKFGLITSKKATSSQKVTMLLKAVKQKISDLFKRDDIDIPF